MVNTYLLAAFSLVWLIFFLYAWNLARRQAALRKELEALKRRTTANPPSGTQAP